MNTEKVKRIKSEETREEMKLNKFKIAIRLKERAIINLKAMHKENRKITDLKAEEFERESEREKEREIEDIRVEVKRHIIPYYKFETVVESE